MSLIREYGRLFPSYKPEEIYMEEFNVVIGFVSEHRRNMEYEERRQEAAKWMDEK